MTADYYLLGAFCIFVVVNMFFERQEGHNKITVIQKAFVYF